MRRITMPRRYPHEDDFHIHVKSSRHFARVYVVEENAGWGLETFTLEEFFVYVNDRLLEKFPREFRAFSDKPNAQRFLWSKFTIEEEYA
jgi:hypothetical protein